jgi:hypothetical protein
MKIKKLLPLVLLAAAAVLMLSSCDAMLDVIFPSNQISVDVMVNRADFPNDWSYGAPATVDFVLYDATANTFSTQSGSWSDRDSNYLHFVFAFLNLKDHVYQMTATYHSFYYALDPSTSTFYDGNSPGMLAVQMPHRTGHDSTGHSADFQMYFY